MKKVVFLVTVKAGEDALFYHVRMNQAEVDNLTQQLLDFVNRGRLTGFTVKPVESLAITLSTLRERLGIR